MELNVESKYVGEARVCMSEERDVCIGCVCESERQLWVNAKNKRSDGKNTRVAGGEGRSEFER